MGGFAMGGGCGFWCGGWFVINFLDLSFVVRLGFGWDLFEFFGFEFCGKIWVLLLWLWLRLGMGKIGADLRLESNISEEWSKRGTREKRLKRVREWVEQERRNKSKWGIEKWVMRGYGVKGVRD